MWSLFLHLTWFQPKPYWKCRITLKYSVFYTGFLKTKWCQRQNFELHYVATMPVDASSVQIYIHTLCMPATKALSSLHTLSCGFVAQWGHKYQTSVSWSISSYNLSKSLGSTWGFKCSVRITKYIDSFWKGWSRITPFEYSKTCPKRPLKNRQNKYLNDKL